MTDAWIDLTETVSPKAVLPPESPGMLSTVRAWSGNFRARSSDNSEPTWIFQAHYQVYLYKLLEIAKPCPNLPCMVTGIGLAWSFPFCAFLDPAQSKLKLDGGKISLSLSAA